MGTKEHNLPKIMIKVAKNKMLKKLLQGFLPKI